MGHYRPATAQHDSTFSREPVRLACAQRLSAPLGPVERMPRRSVSPAVKEALRQAKQNKLEQRARLIGAGIEVPATRRRSKYNQVKATYNGERFDSLGEAEYASKLNLRVAAGQIRSWERPKPIILVDGPTPRSRVSYKPDFLEWRLDGSPGYIDYKGSKATVTQSFRIKVKIWAQKIPYELRIAYADGTETIVAKAHS